MGPYEFGNIFRQNDFEDNSLHVEGGDLALNANLWDNGYPAGGNYWDTYVGVDNFNGISQNEIGSDGIGDIPYQITTANIDHYPLMHPIRSNPEISNQTLPKENYTLIIIIAGAIVVAAVILLGILYWRKTRKQSISTPKATFLGGSSIAILFTLSIMIILNFASITAGTYQLGDIEMFGGALYFDEIPIGFLSAAASLLLTWKIINRIEYKANRPTEILLATFASLLFVVYLLAYSSYSQFELFGLLQYIQPTLVIAWTLITTLIGCALGFLIGGIGLKRLQSASFARQEKHVAQSHYLIASFLILVFIDTLTGYAAGYIS